MDQAKSRGLLRSPLPSPESPSLPSVSVEGKARVDTLLERIDSIQPSEDLSLESQKFCVAWFQEACTDSITLKYANQRLHHYWLSNREAVPKAALFLCANWMAGVGALKLRHEILSILEEDFVGRQSMQAKSPEKFLNAAAFLVEIFIRIRIEARPLSVLTDPVFEYFVDLLSGDDSEIELLAHLVINVTPTLVALQDGDEASMLSYCPLQTLFSKVRSTLKSRNLSSVSRLWLLFIMDVSSSGVLKLPCLTLQEFYKEKDNLGTGVDGLLKSLRNMYPCERKDSAEYNSEIIPENHIQPNPTSSIPNPKNDVEINNQVQALNIIEKTSLGSKKKSLMKVDNQDKRENFRSAFNLDNKASKGRGYWLHDDRFERDDTSPREKKSENLTKPRASQSNWRRPQNQNSDRDISPQSNDSNWRQSSIVKPSVVQPSKVKSRAGHSSDTQPDLADHVDEENWN